MKIYIDTNIYLDYLLGRKNKQGNDLSMPAFFLFKRVIECEFEIIISDHVLRELYGNIDSQDISMLLKFLNKKIIKVQQDEKDKIKSKRYDHQDDALHAVLAIKAKAKRVITRNKKHFKEFSIQAKLPEEV